MEINTLVAITNQKLAGETLLYMQLETFFDQVVDKINSDLNACFPTFSEHRINTGANQNYNYFPDTYIRSVVATGAAYYFYTVDEEGAQAAIQFQYDYREALFIMLRDYADQIPILYKADYRGFLTNENGEPLSTEEVINPDIRFYQGPKGDTGPPGVSPHIGLNGKWWVGTVDTGVRATGLTGSHGFAPFIGEDGYWWVASGKTTVKAQGPPGTPGERGYRGYTGATGPQGPKGDTPIKGVHYWTPDDVGQIHGYINEQLSRALIYKGVISSTIAMPTTIFTAGWVYKVSEAGVYAGYICEVGDMLIASVNCEEYVPEKAYAKDEHVYYDGSYYVAVTNAEPAEPGSAPAAPVWQVVTYESLWDAVQGNVDGVVVGPEAATPGNIATFLTSSGKVIEDSGLGIMATIIDDSNSMPLTSAVYNYAQPRTEALNTGMLIAEADKFPMFDSSIAQNISVTWGAMLYSIEEYLMDIYTPIGHTHVVDDIEGIEAGAQVNKIESVKVNGTALPVTDKAVDVPVVGIKGTGTNAEVFNGMSASQASGNYSHAEGYLTVASGAYSHAEGILTKATGSCAHAEGNATTASGDYSHAEGNRTTAKHRSQHVHGEWNIPDNSAALATSRGNYVRIVGNGTSSSTPSNAETLDWEGNHWVAGKVTVGELADGEPTVNPTAKNDLVHKAYVDAYAQPKLTADSITTGLIASKAVTADKIADGVIVGIKGTGVNAEVFNNVENNIASGFQSHAEGSITKASGDGSHAEGGSTIASGNYSHAEGGFTIANGYGSHAEGTVTVASGEYSHAGGFFTEATHKSQRVYGEHNIADDSTASASERGNYVRIVGNGTADNSRSNAETLDWEGNHWVAGKVTVGELADGEPTVNPTAKNDLVHKAYVDSVVPTKTSDLENDGDGTNNFATVPNQVTTGTSITIANNTEYRLTDVTTLTFDYPEDNFECYIRFTTAADGAVTITFPTSSYIGTAPTFSNGETWEVSIKDGIIIAAKVGDGT